MEIELQSNWPRRCGRRELSAVEALEAALERADAAPAPFALRLDERARGTRRGTRSWPAARAARSAACRSP